MVVNEVLPRRSGGGIPRIYAPAPRSTGQARQRRESHARVPALTTQNGACAGARPEMKGDDVRLALRLPQEVRHGARDERITNTVEAVLAETVTLGYGLIDRVSTDVRRQSRVELAVEAGDVDGGRELLDARLDDLEGLCVVQGCEVVELLDFVVRVWRDNCLVGEVAAVHDAVGYHGNVVLSFDVREFRVVNQGLEEEAEGVLLAFDVVLAILGFVYAGRAAGVVQFGRGGCKAADLELGDLRRILAFCCRVDGDLHGGGSRVHREDDLFRHRVNLVVYPGFLFNWLNEDCGKAKVDVCRE